jgi:hypothetical protein
MPVASTELVRIARRNGSLLVESRKMASARPTSSTVRGSSSMTTHDSLHCE